MIPTALLIIGAVLLTVALAAAWRTAGRHGERCRDRREEQRQHHFEQELLPQDTPDESVKWQ